MGKQETTEKRRRQDENIDIKTVEYLSLSLCYVDWISDAAAAIITIHISSLYTFFSCGLYVCNELVQPKTSPSLSFSSV